MVAHISFFFFFNDTATTEIYTLSLHDALPIYNRCHLEALAAFGPTARMVAVVDDTVSTADRKSTRLNSSHLGISYAVFCLKKKNKKQIHVIEIQQTSEAHTKSITNTDDQQRRS